MIIESTTCLMPLPAALVTGALLAETMFAGKWVFVAALALVLLWLIVMPRSLIGQAKSTPPWWRNVRIWAIVVCAMQIWIYWQYA